MTKYTKSNKHNHSIYPVIERPYYQPLLTSTDSVFKRVSKHPRYLSDWASNVVEIDVSHPISEEKERSIFNLNKIWFPSNSPLGPFRNTVNVCEFPHWVVLLKLSINSRLNTSHTNLQNVIRKQLTMVSRFMSWCVLNGVYEISRLASDDFKELSISLANHNWDPILGTEDRLLSLVLQANNNHETAESLISVYRKNEASVDIDLLNQQTGLQFSRKNIPDYLVDDLCGILGIKRKTKRKSDSYDKPMSSSALYEQLSAINNLFHFPSEADTPIVLPYPNMKALVKKITRSHLAQRTKNLSLEHAVKLLDTALSFVYDYSPIIVSTAKFARNLCDEMPSAKQQDRNLKRVRVKYLELAKRLDAPVASLSGVTQRGKRRKDDKDNASQPPCLMELIHALQTSCMTLIGMNHGRRKQEILGEGILPYGIYRGCVRKEDADIDCHKIDIYVEKTLKDWSTFLCNRLVADSVKVLEDINDCFYLSDAERHNYHFADENSRREKLFRFRAFTPQSLSSNKWNTYTYVSCSDLFHQLACVPLDAIDHKTHVYRRLFSIIYYHRYDNPQLISLKNHLRHRSVEMTRGYVTDPAVRAEAERIEALYKRDRDEFYTDFNAVGKEYLTSKIQDILSEHPTGGGFSKTVFRLYKHLLRRVEFRIMEEPDQADVISTELQSRRYTPSTDKHGMCVISPSCNQHKAKCYDDTSQSIHSENACLKTCMECCYHFDNSNYLSVLKEEASELLERANDFSLTLAERFAYEDQHKELLGLIRSEERIQIKNAENVKYAKANAYLVWCIHDKMQLSINNEQKASIEVSKEISA